MLRDPPMCCDPLVGKHGSNGYRNQEIAYYYNEP